MINTTFVLQEIEWADIIFEIIQTTHLKSTHYVI